tara:strand:- start:1089 stop:1427 length:339 start_codon:yes stop_codon:yes gene_type:complete
MEYYNLKASEQQEIKTLLDRELKVLANELGNELFLDALESGYVDNYECDEEYEEYPEVMQWWIVSDWLADKLREDNEVVMESKGLMFWGRCGYGYALECDFVNIYKSIKQGG